MLAKILSLFLVCASLSVSAFEEPAVFCDPDQSGQLVNILSGDWDTCTYELMFGEVCYQGSQKEVIKILNSKEVREKFSGTDGEYIKRATVYNDGIRYLSVDEKNEVRNFRFIQKCKN